MKPSINLVIVELEDGPQAGPTIARRMNKALAGVKTINSSDIPEGIETRLETVAYEVAEDLHYAFSVKTKGEDIYFIFAAAGISAEKVRV